MKHKFVHNLLLLGKVIMKNIFYAPLSYVHYEVEKILLDKNITRANIILPRGLGKTTLASQVKVLHHIFCEELGENRKKGVVIVSKTQAHAINCMTAIKDVIEYSMEFRAIFGYWGNQNAQRWRDDMIILKDGSYIMAKGMGQPIRGININGVRPTLIILDDPEDENNTKTSEAMDSNLLWLLKGAIPALDTRYGKLIVIGTPIHQLCIVERLADAPDWTTVRYSYITEDEDGNRKSIWPEMKTLEDLDNEKANLEAMGKLSVFYSERMCQIVGDESQLFKPEYIQYYKGFVEYKGDEAFLHKDDEVIPVNVFMGIDPASSTRQTADYSVVFPIAVDANDNVYTLEYFRKRVTPLALAEAIINKYKQFKPVKTRIESVGYQEMLREYLRGQMYIPGLEIKESPRNSKSARLESLQPRFAQKKVWILEGQEDFVNELLMFPRAKFDDLADGYFYATKGIYRPYHSVQLEDKGKKKDTYRKEEEIDWMFV